MPWVSISLTSLICCITHTSYSIHKSFTTSNSTTNKTNKWSDKTFDEHFKYLKYGSSR